MNILVINGSPKGETSITLQTVLYLQKHFSTKNANPHGMKHHSIKHHNFTFLHAGQRIKALEKDFSPALEALAKADLLLFSYPVYTFIAPSQLHRFIELMKQSGINLSGKYATQITTSKHFYDVTAHRYIMQNCQDMGIKFIKGLSADMDDLLKPKGRKEAIAFFQYVQWCINKNIYESFPAPQVAPLHVSTHIPAHKKHENSFNAPDTHKVVIVTDALSEDTSLTNMIARFQAVLPMESSIVNLREYPFQGGCLGCFHCATSGKCIYKDNFDAFLRNEIQKSDAVVYAFTIRDHSMGAVFKQYDDRQFCNGHRTVTMGSPVGYLVSGNYSEEENLHMIIEGRSEVGGNFLAGVATDETNPDVAIDQLVKTLTYAIRHHYTLPQNFYGVGGMKIFRDLIYLMQGMMKADHQFYKKHGRYDFPQKQPDTILKMYLVGALLSSSAIQKKIGNKMTEGMLAPYRKVLEKAQKR